MIFIRLIGFVLIFFIGFCLISYLFNGNKKFLHLAWKAITLVAILILTVFGLLVLERFAIVVWWKSQNQANWILCCDLLWITFSNADFNFGCKFILLVKSCNSLKVWCEKISSLYEKIVLVFAFASLFSALFAAKLFILFICK